jgi:plastocyanin
MRLAKLAFIVAAAASCSKHTPQTFQVQIRGMQFVPTSLQVAVGDHIVWTNKDLVPHTVTSAGTFDSGPLQPNATWSFTVTNPGTLDYVCTLHPTMKAQLIAD